MANVVDIELVKGRTWTRTLLFPGTDLTDCSLRMTIRRLWDDDTPVIELDSDVSGIVISAIAADDAEAFRTLTIDGVRGPDQLTSEGDGQAILTIAKTATDDLSGVYVYDIVLTWADATETELCRGRATILGRATL